MYIYNLYKSTNVYIIRGMHFLHLFLLVCFVKEIYISTCLQQRAVITINHLLVCILGKLDIVNEELR